MERYGKITASFLRYHYFPHLCAGLLLVAGAGAVLSFRALDYAGAAKVMEQYGVLAGILALVPLFVPEADREAWQLEAAKRTPMWKLYLCRLLLAVLVLGGIVSLLTLRLIAGESVFPVWELWRGAFSEALFLGGIGCFAAAVTNQAVTGYMVSVLYYAVNMGAAGRLGKFGLFPICRGDAATWPWLLGGAAALIGAGIVLRERRR